MNNRQPIIDAHVHVWDFPQSGLTPAPFRSATRESLLTKMDGVGVERAVLIQPGIHGDDHRYLHETVARHPDRFAAVALIDHQHPLALDRLNELSQSLPLRGIRLRLKDEMALAAFTSRATRTILERVAELKLTLSVLTSPSGLDVINRIAGELLDLRIVIDHLGSPERFGLSDPSYRRQLAQLQPRENVWIKLSGFYSFSAEPFPYYDCQELIETALRLFGAGRLIWGSDFPFANYETTYAACVKHLSTFLPILSERDRHQVMFENAMRLWW